MEMIYVTRPATRVRKEGRCLRIEFADGSERLVPAAQLSRLTLIGTQALTGAALSFLIQHKVDTVFMSPRGRFLGRLLLDASSHTALRQRQYRLLGDDAFRLALARRIVAGKIANQAIFIARRNKKARMDELGRTARRLRALQRQCPTAGDLDTIRGIEGFAARIYFAAFPLLIRNPGFHFTGRNRRPPRDPVNALLSFGYTMMTNQVISAVQAAGLDPYLGSLHETDSGRPSLACDLVEEYRVLVDRLTLTLVNRRLLRPNDFISQDGGVRLRPAVLKVFIQAVERLFETSLPFPGSDNRLSLRYGMLHQARRFAAMLDNGDPAAYEPFSLA